MTKNSPKWFLNLSKVIYLYKHSKKNLNFFHRKFFQLENFAPDPNLALGQPGIAKWERWKITRQGVGDEFMKFRIFKDMKKRFGVKTWKKFPWLGFQLGLGLGLGLPTDFGWRVPYHCDRISYTMLFYFVTLVHPQDQGRTFENGNPKP